MTTIPTREEVQEFVGRASSGYTDWRIEGRRELLNADAALRAEIERLKAALHAAAEHHEEQADLWNSDNEFGDDETGEYHAERARVLLAEAEGT